jgi:hypothetical protein
MGPKAFLVLGPSPLRTNVRSFGIQAVFMDHFQVDHCLQPLDAPANVPLTCPP